MKKIVQVKDKFIGDGNITIQTMLSRKTVMVEENLQEISELKEAGCDFVRIAVSNDMDVVPFREICQKSVLPVVSDIQFDYKMAIKSIENGASKVRINPSNIGDINKVRKVCDCVKAHKIPMRIGVNMGSLEVNAEKEYGRSAEGLAYSAINCAKMVEDFGVQDLVLSVKASDVKTCVKANRILAEKTNYPLHIGITEAGTREYGAVKNSIGIGALLLDGVGDTIRVSLSATPVEEIYAAKRILKALGLKKGIEVISCPTCNRCDYDLFSLAKEIEDKTFHLNGDLKIAVMGCVVNGIGEGKDADLGIVGGKDGFIVIKKGQIFKKLTKDNYKEEFLQLVEQEIKNNNG